MNILTEMRQMEIVKKLTDEQEQIKDKVLGEVLRPSTELWFNQFLEDNSIGDKKDDYMPSL